MDKRRNAHSYNTHDELAKSLMITGFGEELNNLLGDNDVEEVRVNPDGLVWIVKNGLDQKTDIIKPHHEIESLISIIADHAKTPCTRENPSFSAELPESGFRFHGAIPPQVTHATFVIRKKPSKVYKLTDYVEQGILTENQKDILRAAVHASENILIVGGTGSGKTTFTNAILDEIAATGDRVLIVEDTLELICQSEDKIMMKTVPGIRTMRDCIRDMLRMTPKRIIVGEVRGPEVIDMLAGWNTGHPGGVATIHANSARDSLERIEDLIKQGNALPSRRAIARTINIICFMGKVVEEDNGRKVSKRRVKEILRVTGIDKDENYLFEHL